MKEIFENCFFGGGRGEEYFVYFVFKGFYFEKIVFVEIVFENFCLNLVESLVGHVFARGGPDESFFCVLGAFYLY